MLVLERKKREGKERGKASNLSQLVFGTGEEKKKK